MQYDINLIEWLQNISAPVVVIDGGLVAAVVDCCTVEVVEAVASINSQKAMINKPDKICHSLAGQEGESDFTTMPQITIHNKFIGTKNESQT